MENTSFIAWLVAAGALVVAELLTGTFYLLVLGVCAAVGAAVAFAGAPLAAQLVVAAVAAAAAVFGKVPRKLQAWLAKSPSVQASDIGALVTVTALGETTQFRVTYRGSEWPARLLSPTSLVSVGQSLRVVRVEGIELVCKLVD